MGPVARTPDAIDGVGSLVGGQVEVDEVASALQIGGDVDVGVGGAGDGAAVDDQLRQGAVGDVGMEDGLVGHTVEDDVLPQAGVDAGGEEDRAAVGDGLVAFCAAGADAYGTDGADGGVDGEVTDHMAHGGQGLRTGRGGGGIGRRNTVLHCSAPPQGVACVHIAFFVGDQL